MYAARGSRVLETLRADSRMLGSTEGRGAMVSPCCGRTWSEGRPGAWIYPETECGDGPHVFSLTSSHIKTPSRPGLSAASETRFDFGEFHSAVRSHEGHLGGNFPSAQEGSVATPSLL